MSENALDLMNALLKIPESQRMITESISGNLEVISFGFLPRADQMKWFFSWVQRGLVLARTLWGEGALPKKILFSDQNLDFQMPGLGFFAYAVKLDAIVIGFRAVACCACVDNPDQLVAHYHPGIEGHINARSNTILIVLEECFHRFQVKMLGRVLPPPEVTFTERDDPLEIEWRAVRDDLLAKKVVELRPASQ